MNEKTENAAIRLAAGSMVGITVATALLPLVAPDKEAAEKVLRAIADDYETMPERCFDLAEKLLAEARSRCL